MEGAVSKGEFAAIIGVSPGRISQYLTEGKITAASLVGSGRSAKINVERAKADLRLTLDVGQRIGNGSETRLDPLDEASPLPADQGSRTANVLPAAGGVDYEIKQQKLEQIRRANRNGAIEEAKQRGQLIETDLAQAQMSRVAAAMLEIFEGGLTDMAMAVAAEFKLPQRDVKHLMRRSFRTVRETAAKQMKLKEISLPETVGTAIDAPDIEQSDLT
jgi:hypothetical protein